MSLEPTWIGYTRTLEDALLIFQAVKDKKLKTVSHRVTLKERDRVVRSGHIFVFDEKSSNIRRWTDKVLWSPSRVHKYFLVYREVLERSPRNKKSFSN